MKYSLSLYLLAQGWKKTGFEDEFDYDLSRTLGESYDFLGPLWKKIKGPGEFNQKRYYKVVNEYGKRGYLPSENDIFKNGKLDFSKNEKEQDLCTAMSREVVESITRGIKNLREDIKTWRATQKNQIAITIEEKKIAYTAAMEAEDPTLFPDMTYSEADLCLASYCLDGPQVINPAWALSLHNRMSGKADIPKFVRNKSQLLKVELMLFRDAFEFETSTG